MRGPEGGTGTGGEVAARVLPARPGADSKFVLTFLYLHLLSLPPARQALPLHAVQPSGGGGGAGLGLGTGSGACVRTPRWL